MTFRKAGWSFRCPVTGSPRISTWTRAAENRAWHADGRWGIGWGLLAALFTAVLPTLFISHGVRHGRWDDRNVGARRPRLLVLAFITASVAAGLILLLVLGAPPLVTGYLAFMLASVAVLAVITTVWKISIHCAVASGSVTILALTYRPLVLC